ncbi:DUF4258 domain-containing protein [Roseovarius sp. D22-M7]|uniref:DUF4258 domain-containing protein n=1 Tax=Roseovarius sp. D22-M7 TaxID=3127116 RepID=UPI0030101ACF
MVLFTDHAEDKMEERDITRRMVLKALSRCDSLEDPTWRVDLSNWEGKVVGTSAGARIAIVCAIRGDDLVVTVVTTHPAGR